MRALILLAGLLALGSCDRQKEAGSQAAPAAAARQAGLDRSHAGQPAPAVTFREPDGEEASLADFKAKPLLVNLWATWCAPCVKELPTLAALAGREGAPEVLALSQDMGEQAKVAAFLAEKKVALEPFQDGEMAMSSALGANILPTTVLYGSDGKEIWRYTGDLDWTGAKAAELLKEAQ
jgi:thiol-disulfide isomerase/thioredoxin